MYGLRRAALLPDGKAVEPPAQCRPTVNTLVEFARRAGLPPEFVNFRNAEDVWNEWRMVARGTTYDFWGMTRERLAQGVRPDLALP